MHWLEWQRGQESEDARRDDSGKREPDLDQE